MNNPVRIELHPLGATLTTERGTSLQDVLFARGVEFPCGGRGRCKGCRIKLLEGALPVTVEEQALLACADIADGWRLACRGRAEGDLKIELAQWEMPILADDSRFEFTPQTGLGVAVDLGTTTLVGQLLDLRNGRVLAVATALNEQTRHGVDIVSRMEFALRGGEEALKRLIRQQVGGLIDDLLETARETTDPLRQVVIVGNTVMHHLFCGLDIEPLSRHPFETENGGLQVFRAGDLGWQGAGDPVVRFLPCLGGLVGSDLLAGILATNLHQSEGLAALVDLGTNGEIVVGNRDRLLCASTPAGPAFEGARISMGMRAATGAISEVEVERGRLRCHVLGNTPPRGICGSGLVDAVAAGLELGRIQPSGRLNGAGSFDLLAPVSLLQNDIRELQLAKGAIAAGLRILVTRWGGRMEDLARLYLAGAFGNYINKTSARRIGLLNVLAERIVPAGNTALLGAKRALFDPHDREGTFADVRRKERHLPLSEDRQFQDSYVEALRFPVSMESGKSALDRHESWAE